MSADDEAWSVSLFVALVRLDRIDELSGEDVCVLRGVHSLDDAESPTLHESVYTCLMAARIFAELTRFPPLSRTLVKVRVASVGKAIQALEKFEDVRVRCGIWFEVLLRFYNVERSRGPDLRVANVEEGFFEGSQSSTEYGPTHSPIRLLT